MKDYYTTGELAKLTGVSYKTIRYYLDKKLIKPEYVTDSGYRMYGKKTIETLQRIILLKYLDFSLDSVKEILKEEESLEIFKKQEELLQAQKTHLEQVILAVKEIQKVDENEKWEKMINIINMTARKEELPIDLKIFVTDNSEGMLNEKRPDLFKTCSKLLANYY